MNSFICIGLLCIVSGIVAVEDLDLLNFHRYRRATCDTKYSKIDPNHSMCLTDVGQEVPLTQAEQQAIVDQHNLLREVQGNGQPSATNMQKVFWDEEIAKVASKWVRQCGSGATAHEATPDRRAVPSLPGVSIGQNAANGFTTFEDAIQAWYDEVVDFTYNVGSTNGRVIGHYTQVVNANVARIGCGKALCNGRYHYVCDYAKGQYSSEMKAPYKSGSSAAECPNTVDSSGKLCDCNGLICLNGGNIDVNTCSCVCSSSLYQGANCGNLNCPAADIGLCGTGYLPEYCKLYSNVPEECPHMCGICSNETTTCGKTCQNGGTLDADLCQCTCADGYSGEECETIPVVCSLDCGANGNLISTATECRCSCNNGYTGDVCQTPPCTLNCGTNGDLVSTATECRCQCRNGYTGNTCETAPCTLNCGANGDLVSTATECRCQCRNGYTGNTCQTAPCTLNCGANGDLVSTTTDCRCQCRNGYTGNTCETAPCTLNCGANGDLVSTATECRCQCRNGYTGNTCQTAPCTLNCGVNGDLVSTATECRCQCRNGYTGNTCQTAPCTLNCGANGDLVSTATECRCECRNGYTGNLCQTAPVIECRKECQNGGILFRDTCTCSCPAGFSGSTCEIAPACSLDCQNGAIQEQSPCSCVCPSQRYTGFRCEFDLCSRPDHVYCARLNLGPGYCSNVANRFCPRKCGLCGSTDSQCQLQCLNGGVVDQTYCRCHCPFRYYGNKCEYRRF